jgi:uncharacterized MAPEG superfamily protein
MAFFRKSRKPAAGPRIVIARIEGASEKAGNALASFFLAVGIIAILIAVLMETSAVRLAAWGAIWTGWNVLCAVGILDSRNHFIYTVYRETPPT